MKTRRPVVAIDGPAGAGKSTASRALAVRLGFTYLDTGAIYRALALTCEGVPGLAERIDGAATPDAISPEDSNVLGSLASRLALEFRDGGKTVLLDSENVTADLRRPEIGERASKVSAIPEVRGALLDLQRRMGKGGGVVAEGRDIGTVVFPDAEVKFFLTAAVGERARRRTAELRARGMAADEGRVRDEIAARDERDSGRTVAPLRCAPDAIVVDSSGLTAEDVVDRMVAAVTQRNPA